MVLIRYLPAATMTGILLLISLGVPSDVIGVPGALALIGSLLMSLPAERNNARSERRRSDRRRHA